jgi:hypothetical protein
VKRVSNLITKKLEIMAEAADPDSIISKRKAISALLPYAIGQERCGQREMVDAILQAVRASSDPRFIWHCIGPQIVALFGKPSTPSLNQAITLIFPDISWQDGSRNGDAVTGWAAAASTVPYTEEAGRNVVDVLLQLASVDSLRPQIPINAWRCLKKRLSLPPICQGRSVGTTSDVVHHIRGLGDAEILKSYYLLVWSEWDFLYGDGFAVIQTSITSDFGGIEMRRHREDLIKRLDHILAQLDHGLEHLRQHKPGMAEDEIKLGRKQYEKLKEVLLEVDDEE